MKNKVFLLTLFLLSFFLETIAQLQNNIIPVPQKLEWGKGRFVFTSSTRLKFDSTNKPLNDAIAPLVHKFKTAASLDLLANARGKDQTVVEVSLSKSISSAEGYELVINPQKISIVAQQPAGAFYAVQTLLQLLPEQIEAPEPATHTGWQVPGVRIEDAPRFAYRGIMLDVSRHLMAVDSIKRIIDLLAMQKMNRFHWHLTDNDGWRFQSKKYPKLTQIGAYRKGSPVGNNITYDYNRLPNDSLYGGYYTQEQMKEVVQYAAERFITVIPEIEMPAHAMAAIASYPELACLAPDGKSFPYPQQIQGEFCTKDETLHFITDILSEVMEIFPSKYIHIGGDEAGMETWKTCRYCQQRMKDEKLQDVHALQSYFIKRVEKFVNSKGRSIIGWDEIMKGGVAPNAAVMSWTGIKNGVEAARKKHEVVMTPLPYCYFDHAQSDAPGEPEAYSGLIMLSNVYSYDPVPSGLQAPAATYIRGAQGNLWTEYVPTTAHAEYMLFPRSTALAEVTWSSPAKKSFPDFTRRLQAYFRRLDQHRVHYSRHLYDIRLSNLQQTNGRYVVTISGALNGAPVYYTLDGSTPSIQSPVYRKPISIAQSCTLQAAIIKDGQITDLATKEYRLHKAVGKKGTLQIKPDYVKSGINGWHNGSLCDNQRINDFRFEDETRYNDDTWIGWNDNKFDGTIDFGKPESIHKVTMRFFHNIPFGIMIPRSVVALISNDGIHFKQIATASIALPKGNGAVNSSILVPGLTARYLRIVAEPYGPTPAGNNAWLYVDEVIVE